MDKQDERKLLKTLKSIDDTLKRIEQDLKSRPINQKEMFEETLRSAKENGGSSVFRI